MMHRRTLLAIALLVPVAGLMIAAGSGGGTGDDVEMVKKHTAEFQAAWNKHDSKALAAFWAKDGDLIDPAGILSTGAAEVEKFFAAEHSGEGHLAKSTFAITKDTARMVSADVALEDWEVTLTGLNGPDGKPAGPMVHRVVVISKKEGGAWKISAARPGVPMPEGAKTGEMPKHKK